MHRGYTKRWRKRWKNGYHQDFLLWIMMDYFIDYANWKDNEFPFIWKGKLVEMVKIKRGECFFTFKGLADFLNSSKNKVSRKMVRERVVVLQKIGFLGHKKGHQYQVVTVLNYDKYNPPTEDECHQSAHKPATNVPPMCHQSTTPKEYNKDKKVNNNTYSVSFSSFWNEYPVKKGKGSAYKSWLKKKPDIENVLLAIKNQIDEKEKLKANQQFCPEWPHPTTWLNQERWDDEEYDIIGDEDGLARFLQRHQDTG